MRRYGLLSFLAAALLVTSAAVALRGAGGQNPPAGTEPAFKGKVVMAMLKGGDSRSVALEQVRLQRLGERSFVVGRGVDDGHPENWYKGLTIWTALEDVAQLIEFNDLDHLRKVTKEHLIKAALPPPQEKQP